MLSRARLTRSCVAEVGTVRINPRLRFNACAIAVFGLTSPAAAELARVTDDGFVSRHEVVVEASPKDVWLALIAPAGWWRSEHTWSGDAANLTLTPQAGGCFCETIPEVDEPDRFTLQGSVEHMRVVQAYPEQALRMQGALGPLQSEPVIGVLTVTISSVDAGTRIVWEYNVGGSMRYDVPVIAKAVDGVMGVQTAALAELLGPVALPEPDGATPQVESAVDSDSPAPTAATKPEPVRPAPALSAPASRPALQPAAKPIQKPAPGPASVDDAFGDLEDAPQR